MSITTMAMVAAALIAAAPSGDGSRLEEYGGAHRCKDEAVKAQVVRTLGSGKTQYPSNAIAAAPGKLVYDSKPIAISVGKATAIVSQPGGKGTPSTMKLSRAGAGAAVDVLMCRYRRTGTKGWNAIGTSDLVVDGHLAKRMPADVRNLGRSFALNEDPKESEDSVVVLVAAGVGGKASSFDVSVAARGPLKNGMAKDPSGMKDPGKKILAQAFDPSWETYEYGDMVVFPEAAEIPVEGEKKFDCSYFVWLVYKRAGIDYTFTGTEGLSKLGGGEFVEVTNPRPGDLVVWRPERGLDSAYGHVGIIIDDKTFRDNSSKRSVDTSEVGWSIYANASPQYLRRKGL
jgi:cell wall-associated NlpC family hydrolase